MLFSSLIFQGGIVLDGRKLNVVIAVPKEKAAELKQPSKDKEIKDKRNLWLVREGSMFYDVSFLKPVHVRLKNVFHGILYKCINDMTITT